MGSRTGLDYQGVEIVSRIHGIDLSTELFSKIQLLERAVIKIDQENHAKQN